MEDCLIVSTVLSGNRELACDSLVAARRKEGRIPGTTGCNMKILAEVQFKAEHWLHY